MKHVEAWVAVGLPLGPGLVEETLRDTAGPRSLATWLSAPLVLRRGEHWYTPHTWGVTLNSLATTPSNERPTASHNPHIQVSTSPHTLGYTARQTHGSTASHTWMTPLLPFWGSPSYTSRSPLSQTFSD